MTHFEKYLIDKGYIKYIFNCKTMTYQLPNEHKISTMVNLDHRYYHKSDLDRTKEICFGLNEANKPPTLISPRPSIKVKRLKKGKQVTENENMDDSMNVVLQMVPPADILKAMFDKSICIEIDLTNDCNYCDRKGNKDNDYHRVGCPDGYKILP